MRELRGGYFFDRNHSGYRYNCRYSDRLYITPTAAGPIDDYAVDYYTEYVAASCRFLRRGMGDVLFSRDGAMRSRVYMLSLIGLHILLSDSEQPSVVNKISPFFLALIVSIDAFGVSVTFGMMQLNKWLFVLASGFFRLYFRPSLYCTQAACV